MSNIDLIDWIDWLEDGEIHFGDCREEFLTEQIDKANRRGAINDEIAERLIAHFRL